MKILVVDDHPLVRRGLISTLSFEDGIEKIEEAGNIQSAMKHLKRESYDCAIVDLNLGSEDGLNIVREAHEYNIPTKFIILTSSMKKEDFKRARETGIQGYILKEAFAEDIVYAIKVVLRGKNFFDSEMMRYDDNEEESRDVFKDLTKRELDVMEELKKGYSNKEIGESLYISESTVKKHVSNILSKLNLNHRTQVVILAGDKL